ncbi:hypothetical protein H8R18_01155 [Nanchangia anserum]|uniref:HTH cro/C1-type domain-containing protein n=1 Tax=Nanchangia anserum TaxID=2692125 RepID=A0A8I0GD77_9ACTO|nr:hypothetical protein [Nanchangia anserum]MBD3689846.1 hypothetical protein [Nanchangia anserum]QOX82012.1 hypothetical protein H8R18_01155 [Nanchangia anserum]
MKTPDMTVNWYRRVADGMTVNAVATAADMTQSTLDRQIKRGNIPAPSVIAIARGLDLNPVSALVECGYLAAEEVAGDVQIIDWTTVSDSELCAEVLRRIKDAPADRDEATDDTDNATETEDVEDTAPARPLTIVEDRADRVSPSQRPGYDPEKLAALAPGYSIEEEREGRANNQP